MSDFQEQMYSQKNYIQKSNKFSEGRYLCSKKQAWKLSCGQL